MSITEQIKDRLDIVEVIQTYVPLKKAGRNYKGLCPFHGEKTPSFVVFPDTGTWHCFGACGIGGDLIAFVMKQENLEFGEALKLMAQRAGVELEPPSPQAAAAAKRNALLHEINQAAATYFHHLLVNSDEALRARNYLEERGLNRETIDRFQIGYALDSWEGLLKYLSDKGYGLEQIAEVGLVIERDDKSGYYDRFRKRVVFTIRDHQGRTIGFGGRVLDNGVPKYLNSPQSPLFDKSSVLFGLDQAKRGIRTTGEAVIVEGYMDVLIAHQYGFNNVVAQMGTALTEAQLRQLKRHTERVILALDSDVAGDQATLRGLDVARQVMDHEAIPVPTPRGLIRFEDRLSADIRIVSLPAHRDPDEVIRESTDRWMQLIDQAKPLMDYYFDALTADLDLSTAKGKADAVQALGPLIAEVGDQVQRTHYLQRLARIVQVDERSLWQQIRRDGAKKRTRSRPARARAPESSDRIEQSGDATLELDAHILSLILSQPELLAQADSDLRSCGEEALGIEDFPRSEDQAVFSAWKKWLPSEASPDARGVFYDALDESLQDRVEVMLQASDDQPPVADGRLRADFLDAVSRLRLRNLRRQIHELRFLLEDSSDSDVATLYGPLIANTAVRMRRLQLAINERSISGRRQQEDATVRVLYDQE